jgi:hypothetical protein
MNWSGDYVPTTAIMTMLPCFKSIEVCNYA